VISVWGLSATLFTLGVEISRGDHLALQFLLWGLLGLTPLWTGITYTREACVLTRQQAAAHGAVKTGLAAIAGSLTATCIVAGAQILDSRFVATRLAPLDTKDPETWRAALAFFKAYPLCGRMRCRRLVCERLRRQFHQPGESWLAVPVPIDIAFTEVFGVASGHCISPL
jgi:hypothetical protein